MSRGAGITKSFGYDNLHRLSTASGPDPISLVYDLRGNIMQRTGNHLTGGDSHTVTWTSYQLPENISNPAGNSSQFSYAPDRSRWRQVASDDGTTETTVHIAGILDKVTTGSVISWRHYIAGGTGTVALYTRQNTGANEVRYVTHDHLGSPDAITDVTGSAEFWLGFGAFGERRDAADAIGGPSDVDWSAIADSTRRGFTSHEMLDNLSLIHMNGRVYDPFAARFLSPDPFVQAPQMGQSFNRYAYTFNNPLSYVDPSGYATEDGPDGPGQNLGIWLLFGGGTAGVVKSGYPAPHLPAPHTQDGVTVGGVLSAAGGHPCSMIGGGGGGTAARGGCYFVNDPNISDQTKINTAVIGTVLMTGGAALNALPLAAVPLVFGLEVQGVADGMPLRLPLFKNRFPQDPIDYAKIVPTSQLSRISGNFNYVITPDGRLTVGRSAHTSLTVGADVMAAGEVQLLNGNIRWIDNASGHYRPTGAGLSTLVEDAFSSVGLDATGKFILRAF